MTHHIEDTGSATCIYNCGQVGFLSPNQYCLRVTALNSYARMHNSFSNMYVCFTKFELLCLSSDRHTDMQVTRDTSGPGRPAWPLKNWRRLVYDLMTRIHVVDVAELNYDIEGKRIATFYKKISATLNLTFQGTVRQEQMWWRGWDPTGTYSMWPHVSGWQHE